MKKILTAILVALLLAPAGSGYSSHQSLDEVASWLAQRPVEVHCLTQKESEQDLVLVWGADAYVLGTTEFGVWKPFDFTAFRYGICETLLKLESGDLIGVAIPDLAWAILVITHESGHLRGWRWSGSEAKTQCWAMRHFRYTAQRMGVTDPVLLKVLVASALTHHQKMPPHYQLAGCKLPTP